jgi:hypothetical protein
VDVGATQALLALQVDVLVNVDPLHVAPAHVVPVAYFRQPPFPSQVPSSPQVDAAAAGHWLAGVGAVPAGTELHVPTDPVSAHETQVPLQAVEQQTPCAQFPVLHSGPVLQLAPFGFLPQLIALVLQLLGEAQSVSAVQVVLHVVALRQL